MFAAVLSLEDRWVSCRGHVHCSVVSGIDDMFTDVLLWEDRLWEGLEISYAQLYEITVPNHKILCFIAKSPATLQ